MEDVCRFHWQRWKVRARHQSYPESRIYKATHPTSVRMLVCAVLYYMFVFKLVHVLGWICNIC